MWKICGLFQLLRSYILSSIKYEYFSNSTEKYAYVLIQSNVFTNWRNYQLTWGKLVYLQLEFVCFWSRCDKEWDDYVEWGDYSFMPTDSRFWRRCGYISSPNLRISGGGPPAKFLRLTFRSNDRWADRTGFHASFTFTRQINHVTSSTFSNGGRNVIFPNKQTTPLLLFFLGTYIYTFTRELSPK